MKKSTRTTLVVFIIFYFCYLLWEATVGEVSHQFEFAIVIGLIVIWILKVKFGYKIDGKED
jgi:uncharacterized membrane protein YdbT with pleckstrin-like domain